MYRLGPGGIGAGGKKLSLLQRYGYRAQAEYHLVCHSPPGGLVIGIFGVP